MTRPYFPGDRVVCAGVVREVLTADRIAATDHLRVVLDDGTEIGGLTATVHKLIPHADEVAGYQTPEPKLCGAEYVSPEQPDGYPRPRCDRPTGHRDDATSVWQDPDGCHSRAGLIWTRARTAQYAGGRRA